jgi:hypothetical protein
MNGSQFRLDIPEQGWDTVPCCAHQGAEDLSMFGSGLMGVRREFQGMYMQERGDRDQTDDQSTSDGSAYPREKN